MPKRLGTTVLEDVGLDLRFEERIRLDWVKRDMSKNFELLSQGPAPSMTGPNGQSKRRPVAPSEYVAFIHPACFYGIPDRCQLLP